MRGLRLPTSSSPTRNVSSAFDTPGAGGCVWLGEPSTGLLAVGIELGYCDRFMGSQRNLKRGCNRISVGSGTLSESIQQATKSLWKRGRIANWSEVPCSHCRVQGQTA